MNDNQNPNANLLKKIEIGNPLYNLGLFALLEQYEQCKNDEELADFYHKFLNIIETGSKPSLVVRHVAYMMINYSTGKGESPLFLEMQEVIHNHNINL